MATAQYLALSAYRQWPPLPTTPPCARRPRHLPVHIVAKNSDLHRVLGNTLNSARSSLQARGMPMLVINAKPYLGVLSSSSSHQLLQSRVRGVVRRTPLVTELDADEEEQVYELEPSEQVQGGINHLMFMLEVLSHIKEFEAVIPNSGQNPPWCGDGDRFFVDNQAAIARALLNAHTAWDRFSGSRRAWKGSLVGMAFSIEAMEEDQLVAGIMSKADYQLLYSALTPGMTAKRMVGMMAEEDLKRADIFTVAIYARDWLEMFVPQL